MASCDHSSAGGKLASLLLGLLAITVATVMVSNSAVAGEVLRAGIVGCDTSHAVAFTKLLNGSNGNGLNANGDLAKVRVVAAFPGGSDDISSSRDRVGKFTAQLREMGVEIVESIDDLPGRCDVFLLESVDGRVHLVQFRAIALGRPVFVDKPAAASLAEVMALFEIAERTGTPCFSSSALRFCAQVQALKNDPEIGEVLGASTSSPFQIEPHHPDLFWYAIHGIESLYALMGKGCEHVSRTEGDAADVVVGKWSDGRLGVFRGLKQGASGRSAYTFSVFGRQQIKQSSGFDGYEPLVEEICRFFVTGKPPVTKAETLEIFAFMEAADESQQRGGSPIAVEQMMERAREKQDDLLAD